MDKRTPHAVHADIGLAGLQVGDTDQQLVLQHSQDIPKSWRTMLAEMKKESWDNRRNTEHIRVASVPVIFIHKWLQEGFNAYVEPVQEVVKRIRREGLTEFLATEKRVF
jgi:hypothetical protein